MSRIGVFVCHCGLNIAKTVRVSELAEFAATLPDVVVARDYKFMCSTPGQEMIQRDIKEYKLDRVIVTACSPLMHEKTFRKVIENAGLNQYLLTIVNIREQLSWVTHDIEEGTAKAKALLNGALLTSTLMYWSSAVASPEFRQLLNWPIPAQKYISWKKILRSAAIWPSLTKHFPLWIAPPVF